MDSIGLVKVLAKLNQGMDWSGKTLGGATNFTIGVALNPLAEDLDYEIQRFHTKVEGGAHFAMTQPLFDPQHWHDFLKRLGGPCPIPVLLGVWPPAGQTSAFEQRSSRHRIPEPVLKANGIAIPRANTILHSPRKMLAWALNRTCRRIFNRPFKRYEEILYVEARQLLSPNPLPTDSLELSSLLLRRVTCRLAFSRIVYSTISK